MTSNIETKLSELEARIAELETLHKPQFYHCTLCNLATKDSTKMNSYCYTHGQDAAYGLCIDCAKRHSYKIKQEADK